MHILYSCLSLYFYLSVYPLSPLMGSCRSIWPVICSRNCFALWPLMGEKKPNKNKTKKKQYVLFPSCQTSVFCHFQTNNLTVSNLHTATTAAESRGPQVISCWQNNRRLMQPNLFKKSDNNNIKITIHIVTGCVIVFV